MLLDGEVSLSQGQGGGLAELAVRGLDMLVLQSEWWICWACNQGGGHAGFVVRVVDMLGLHLQSGFGTSWAFCSTSLIL